jgi:hypothetical protein
MMAVMAHGQAAVDNFCVQLLVARLLLRARARDGAHKSEAESASAEVAQVPCHLDVLGIVEARSKAPRKVRH